MDQDSFRRLLQTQRLADSPSSRASKPKNKQVDASQPAFKPRKVNKSTESRYRDRAAERRGGEASDYAQVEAVLEDFEKRNANNEDKSAVEAQRRYLGGDSDHSILVKGLDLALLEQNKARAAALNTADDDSLEQAFLEVSSSHSIVPKKRTREDLIRELKEKRLSNESTPTDTKQPSQKPAELEAAKKNGKFKPIGFKPISVSEDTGKKKPKGGERKKKRRKVVENSEPQSVAEAQTADNVIPPTPLLPQTPNAPAPISTEPEHEPPPDDFDIFVGAGDYEGVDLGDDDDEGDTPSHPSDKRVIIEEEPLASRRWIEYDEPEPVPENPKPNLLSSVLKPASPPPAQQHLPEDEGESMQPLRLQPLESSALPSIKDFLAMEDAANGSGKWKNKKSKKKGADANESKKNAEAKVDRDYKRLKNYTEQKAGTAR